MPDPQPYRNFNFRVEIDGISAAQFAEVVVPTASITVSYTHLTLPTTPYV